MRKFAAVAGFLLAGISTFAVGQPAPVSPLFGDGLEPGIIGFGPNTTRVEAGAGNVSTAPVPLRVTLSEPAAASTFIPIVSSEPTRLSVVGGGVTVTMGNTSAVVVVNAVAGGQSSVPVILTAQLNATRRSAGVRVEAALNETGLAAEADFCNVQFPTSFTVAEGAQTPQIFGRLFEAGVTEPMGPPVGWYAELGYGPASGSDPRQLIDWFFFPATYNTQVGNDDEFQGAFAAPAGNGAYAYTYRFSSDNGATYTYCDLNGAGSGLGLEFEVANLGSMTVGVAAPTHLVINEVDYDQIGADTAEFIEVFNPTGATISLSGKSLVFVNGSGNTTYLVVDLAPAATLAPGQYLVVHSSVVIPHPAARSIVFVAATDNIQNGAPDGVALVDNSNGTLIDALSYEGSITAAAVTGIAGLVNLVEGAALPVGTADSNTVAGSLARLPNGTDTDNAASDWNFTSTLTPGTANVP